MADFFTNPVAQAGLQGGGQFLQLLFGDREGKRHRKFQHEQQRMLAKLFGGQLGSGSVINPQQMQMLTSQFQQGARPTLDMLGFQATRHAGLSSPEAHRLGAQAQLPLLAQFQGGLARQNISLTQSRDAQLRQLLASLSGA